MSQMFLHYCVPEKICDQSIDGLYFYSNDTFYGSYLEDFKISCSPIRLCSVKFSEP